MSSCTHYGECLPTQPGCIKCTQGLHNIRPQLVDYYIVSHRPPAWILCDRIYHYMYYFYLHISVTLNKWVIGVMSIRNDQQTCLSSVQYPQEPIYNGGQWATIILPSCLSTLFVRNIYSLNNGNTRPPALCAGEACDVKLKINELGPYSRQHTTTGPLEESWGVSGYCVQCVAKVIFDPVR